jgi:hypothetical protein
MGAAGVIDGYIFSFDIEPADHLPEIKYCIRIGAAALFNKTKYLLEIGAAAA